MVFLDLKSSMFNLVSREKLCHVVLSKFGRSQRAPSQECALRSVWTVVTPQGTSATVHCLAY